MSIKKIEKTFLTGFLMCVVLNNLCHGAGFMRPGTRYCFSSPPDINLGPLHAYAPIPSHACVSTHVNSHTHMNSHR